MKRRVRARTRTSRAADPGLFLNRELSWLDFNSRVLEEARDRSTPLLERLKFAVIAASNLDEFFMVRVASLERQIEEEDLERDPAGLTPAEQLEAVSLKAHALAKALHQAVGEDILPALATHGLRLQRVDDLGDEGRLFVRAAFAAQIAPALTPLAIDAERPFPLLTGLGLNLGVLLAPAATDTPPAEADPGAAAPGMSAPERAASPLPAAPQAAAQAGGMPRLAVVPIPPRMPRLLRVASGKEACHVLIEDVVRDGLGLLFPGQTIAGTVVFRVTRDAELELDDEGGRAYVEILRAELRGRRRSEVVRLELQAEERPELSALLVERIGVRPRDIYEASAAAPLDPGSLQPLLDLPAPDALRDPLQRPLPPAELPPEADLFGWLEENDLLLHHPYDSFDPVVALLDRAADDPDVLAIKQTLYRTSGDSPVARALGRAADRGKQVTVLVELRARFDEWSNIRWAEELERAGAHVLYGVRGFKTHAKILIVVRRTGAGIRRYIHLGTGNYNDRTARQYTDYGLMTSDPVIGADASAFFNALTGYSDPPEMKKLVMAPTRLRARILALIGRERRRAEEGQAAEIRAKMNALVDPEVIAALGEAAAAGVRLRLNVRGICCLRPPAPGRGAPVSVVSVVDRYLEHARVFWFRNGGDEELYLASADWMPRNLDRRIELMFPVEAEPCRGRVLQALDAMFKDNVKARVLGPDGVWTRRRPEPGEAPYRAQVEQYRERLGMAKRSSLSRGVVFEPIASPRASAES
jgi:polyphosphate kinase